MAGVGVIRSRHGSNVGSNWETQLSGAAVNRLDLPIRPVATENSVATRIISAECERKSSNTVSKQSLRKETGR
jgi:hypothetical protein